MSFSTHQEILEEKNIRPIVIASHPRSGTHLLMDLIRKQFSGCKVMRRWFQCNYEPYINLDEIISLKSHICNKELRLLSRSRMPIIKTHRLPNYYEPYQFTQPVAKERAWLADYIHEKSVVIYTYRDVLKTLISLFEFYPKHVRACSFSEFIREVRGKRELSRVGFFAKHLSTWFSENNVLVVNFDKILQSPHVILDRIAEHLDESPLYVEPLLPAKPGNRVTRKLGYLLSTEPESTAILTFRKDLYSVQNITANDRLFIENEISHVAPELLGTDVMRGIETGNFPETSK